MFKTIKNSGIIIIASAAVYFCISYPEEIAAAVYEAIDRCLYMIIPSMFVFMCITTFISNSGIHSILGLPFKFISEKLFHLPKEGFAIFLLSMISGYPAGIKIISENFQNKTLNAKQAYTMSCFCCCAGPAFITGTVSSSLYPDTNAGILIFLAVFTGNLTTAFIYTRKLDKPNYKNNIKFRYTKKQFIPSIKSACYAMLHMCAMITAFGGISCILKVSGITDILSEYTVHILNSTPDITESIFFSFLEISNILNLPQMEIGLFPVTAFLISFGGICVHLQIAALADNNFSATAFFISRMLSASVSGITAYFLIPFLTIDISCSAQFEIISENRYSPLPTLFLIIMICLTLTSFKKSEY